MDEPARKRRKTTSPEAEILHSPLKRPPRRPSVASRSYFTAEHQRSSPLKAPPRRFSVSPTKGALGRSSSPLKEAPRKPPRRPSFASPTKASLARGYPELLQQPSSSKVPARNGRAELLERGKQARAFILSEQNGAQHVPMVVEQNEDRTTAGAQSPDIPDPLPVPTPRMQKSQQKIKTTWDEEADLPATPSQRTAEEQYTPRLGLFSSPSKRPPRLNDTLKKTRLLRKPTAVQRDTSGMPVDGHVQETLNEVQQAQQGERQPPNPEAENKKHEIVRLEKELRLLETQVSMCTEEIAKSQAQPATYVGSPEERESLVVLINELGKVGEETKEDRTNSLSSTLCSFLPFATQRIAAPQLQVEKAIATHQPLKLDDPLPYLQMFTSFEFRTKLNLPRGKDPRFSNRVHQKHVIDITGPQSLLTATISITIDTLSNTIIDLRLLRIPHWSDRELGSFIRARAKEKDLSNACWAIGSYWDVAKKRAEYWHRCEIVFGHLIPGRTSEDTENLNVRSQGKSGHGLSRRDLNRHLGRDTLVLEDRHVLLEISWRIGFDWTGEAESEVTIVPAVPRIWREADTNDSFAKIPETFTSLLQSKGVFAATKTMVALLFSE